MNNGFKKILFFRSCSKKCKGVILLEAILTVVILSVGLTYVIQSMSSSIRAIVYSSDYSTAILLSENKIFELMGGEGMQADVNEEKKFSEPHEKFQYSLSIQGAQDKNLQEIKEMDLDVAWTSGKKRNSVAISTYVFKTEQ